MKTIALLLAAAAVGVQPNPASVGEELTVTGPATRAVVLEPFDVGGGPVALGTTGADGRLVVPLPDVDPGRYRILVGGEPEAPVLEVTPRALGRDTSALLLGFGFVLVLGLVVAGVVVHRRWRDAIS